MTRSILIIFCCFLALLIGLMIASAAATLAVAYRFSPLAGDLMGFALACVWSALIIFYLAFRR